MWRGIPSSEEAHGGQVPNDVDRQSAAEAGRRDEERQQETGFLRSPQQTDENRAQYEHLHLGRQVPRLPHALHFQRYLYHSLRF